MRKRAAGGLRARRNPLLGCSGTLGLAWDFGPRAGARSLRDVGPFADNTALDLGPSPTLARSRPAASRRHTAPDLRRSPRPTALARFCGNAGRIADHRESDAGSKIRPTPQPTAFRKRCQRVGPSGRSSQTRRAEPRPTSLPTLLARFQWRNDPSVPRHAGAWRSPACPSTFSDPSPRSRASHEDLAPVRHDAVRRPGARGCDAARHGVRRSPVGPNPTRPGVGPSPVRPSARPSVRPSPVGPSVVEGHPVGPHPVCPSPVRRSPVCPSPVRRSLAGPSPVAPHPVAPSPLTPDSLTPDSPDLRTERLGDPRIDRGRWPDGRVRRHGRERDATRR